MSKLFTVANFDKKNFQPWQDCDKDKKRYPPWQDCKQDKTNKQTKQAVNLLVKNWLNEKLWKRLGDLLSKLLNFLMNFDTQVKLGSISVVSPISKKISTFLAAMFKQLLNFWIYLFLKFFAKSINKLTRGGLCDLRYNCRN